MALRKPRLAIKSAHPCQYSHTPAPRAATAATTSITATASPVFDEGVSEDPGSEGVGRRAWRSRDAERRVKSTARRRWESKLRSNIAKSLPSLILLSSSNGMMKTEVDDNEGWNESRALQSSREFKRKAPHPVRLSPHPHPARPPNSAFLPDVTSSPRRRQQAMHWTIYV